MPDRRPKLLIVDDEQALLWLLADVSTDHGYEVMTAETGGAGLRAALRARPDIVLLDVNMAGQTGWDVLRQLRTNDQTSRTPVVMMTGTESAMTDPRARRSAADAILLKPFQLAVLIETLARMLGSEPNTSASEVQRAPARRDA